MKLGEFKKKHSRLLNAGLIGVLGLGVFEVLLVVAEEESGIIPSSSDVTSESISSSSELSSSEQLIQNSSEPEPVTSSADTEEAVAEDIPMGFYASGAHEDVKPTEKLLKSLYQPTAGARQVKVLADTPDNLSSDDASLPRKDFVDIASWQSWMTQADFNNLKNRGVKGVCIKLTQDTNYRNPYAKSFITMAKNAGLVVSVYHYSMFANDSKARSEATYFAQYAKELGLSSSTLMVNDIEDPATTQGNADPTLTSLAFQNQLKALGFSNVMHYCSQSWVGDYTKYMEPRYLGATNIWVAQYLYGKPSKNNLLNTGNAAWQFSSQMYYTGMSRSAAIDTNIDYTGRFTGGSVISYPDLKPTAEKTLQYKAHVQDVGWQAVKNAPNTAGTTGKALRVEALQLAYNESGVTGDIVYSTHVQDIGWQSEVKNGQAAGTSGQSKRIEAIKIRLTGALANKYHIQYRTHVQDVGWQGWVSDGAVAGTVGKAKRVEAIEVKLVPKTYVTINQNYVNADTGAVIQTQTTTREVGATVTVTPPDISGYYKPGAQTIKIAANQNGLTAQDTKNQTVTFNYIPTILKPTKTGVLQYRTHVQNVGWQAVKNAPNTAGTTGKALRVEALQLAYNESGVTGDIVYSTHVQDIGWQSEVKNGQIAGTVGKAKRIEAVKIRLTGALASKYHIQYRTHVQDVGWQGWVSDGAIAGTVGKAKRVEAIEVRLVKK
ncbi:MAG: lysozyme [Streptococcaceae bacterium]|nr:lysozyme [Streptococcaceae bacterium]